MSHDARSRGGELLKAGDIEGALAALKEAVHEDPNDLMAWQLLGAAYGGSGHVPEAVDAFQKAVTLQPTSARARFNLAIALQKAERNDEARTQLERAVALDPGHEQAKLRLTALSGGVPPPRPATAPVSAPAPAPLAAPAPVAPPPAPVAVGLAPIGGLSAIGGGPSGGASPATAAPTGMPSLASVGAATPLPQAPVGGPPPLGSVPMAAAAPPPMASAPGAYRPPTAAYAGTPTSGDFIADGARRMGFDAVRDLQGDWDRAMKGWNWGAFTFGPLWLWAHGLRPFAIIVAVVLWALRIFLSPSLGFPTANAVVDILSIVFQFFLGMAGNQLATQERTWNDADDFMDTQRVWMYWSIPFAIGRIWLISMTIVSIVLALGGR